MLCLPKIFLCLILYLFIQLTAFATGIQTSQSPSPAGAVVANASAANVTNSSSTTMPAVLSNAASQVIGGAIASSGGSGDASPSATDSVSGSGQPTKQISVGPDLNKLFLCKRDPSQNFKVCEKAINFFCSGYCTADSCSDCSNRAICLDVCGEVSALMLTCVQSGRGCGNSEDLFKSQMSPDNYQSITAAKAMPPASSPPAPPYPPGYPQMAAAPGYPAAPQPGMPYGAVPGVAYPGQMPATVPGGYPSQPGMPYGAAMPGAYPGQMMPGMGVNPLTGQPMTAQGAAASVALQSAGLNPQQAAAAQLLGTGLAGFRRPRS